MIKELTGSFWNNTHERQFQQSLFPHERKTVRIQEKMNEMLQNLPCPLHSMIICAGMHILLNQVTSSKTITPLLTQEAAGREN